jgi:hypothetical protein
MFRARVRVVLALIGRSFFVSGDELHGDVGKSSSLVFSL